MWKFICYFSCLDVYLLSVLVVVCEINKLLNQSGLEKYIEIDMWSLPCLFILGIVSICFGLLSWFIDLEHHANDLNYRKTLNTDTVHNEPLLFLGDADSFDI